MKPTIQIAAMGIIVGVSSLAQPQGGFCSQPSMGEEVQTFYEKLAPYGKWFVCEPYGWVWQPYEVKREPDWRPYCHGGRWIWVSGRWHWHSTYAWGWAPFHYGWWVRVSPHGWLWVPGLVWAPAWVQWYECAPYVAWAPLPPPCVPRTGFSLSVGSAQSGWSWSVTLAADDFVCARPEHFAHIEVWRVARPVCRVPDIRLPPLPAPPPPALPRPPSPPPAPFWTSPATLSRRSEGVHAIVHSGGPGFTTLARGAPPVPSVQGSRASAVQPIIRGLPAAAAGPALPAVPSVPPAGSSSFATPVSARLERVRQMMGRPF